jgi:hypothetical protein
MALRRRIGARGNAGTSVNLQFTWDSELAVQQTSTIWSPGPLASYVMNVGDATIHGAAV